MKYIFIIIIASTIITTIACKSSQKKDSHVKKISTKKPVIKIQKKITSPVKSVYSGNDALHIMNLMDTYLEQVEASLQSMRVLAIRSANGTYNRTDRRAMNIEFSHYLKIIVHIMNNAQYKGALLLNSKNKKAARFIKIKSPLNNSIITFQLLTFEPRLFNYSSWMEKEIIKNFSILTPEGANVRIGYIDNALSVFVRGRVKVRSYRKQILLLQKIKN